MDTPPSREDVMKYPAYHLPAHFGIAIHFQWKKNTPHLHFATALPERFQETSYHNSLKFR